MSWTLSWIEMAGFVSGALCVWLVVRRSIWNFPIGLANNIFFWVLFMRAGLYGDAWLQIGYLMLGALGWYWWLHGGVNRTALVVRRTPDWGWVLVLGFVALATWVVHTLLTAHTDSVVPLGDAFTTALSLGAQIMLNRKWIGNWWLWITADLCYIALYLVKGLYLTAILYVLFLTMCVIGLRQWRRAAAAAARGGSTDTGQVADREPAGAVTEQEPVGPGPAGSPAAGAAIAAQPAPSTAGSPRSAEER